MNPENVKLLKVMMELWFSNKQTSNYHHHRTIPIKLYSELENPSELRPGLHVTRNFDNRWKDDNEAKWGLLSHYLLIELHSTRPKCDVQTNPEMFNGVSKLVDSEICLWNVRKQKKYSRSKLLYKVSQSRTPIFFTLRNFANKHFSFANFGMLFNSSSTDKYSKFFYKFSNI